MDYPRTYPERLNQIRIVRTWVPKNGGLTPTEVMYNHWRKWFAGVKRNRGCALCKENDPDCLVFHHIDTKTKRFCCSFSNTLGRDVGEILREISKCAVLCLNCHSKIHKAVKELLKLAI